MGGGSPKRLMGGRDICCTSSYFLKCKNTHVLESIYGGYFAYVITFLLKNQYMVDTMTYAQTKKTTM